MPADQTGTPSATTTADRLGWLTTFAAGFADPDGTAPRSNLDDYTAPADGAGTVRTAGDQLVGAIKNGAADRPLQLGGNAMPGGWRWRWSCGSTSYPAGISPWPPARTGIRRPRRQRRRWRSPRACSPRTTGARASPFGPRVQVPGDAPPLQQLLGLSGRDPHWTA